MRSKTLIPLAIAALAGLSLQAQAAIMLNSAGGFGLLGGSGVSNTGSSVINNGSVGSSPTPAVTGFPPGLVNNGLLYRAADPVTAQAHTDLIAAYTAAQTAMGGVAGPADLGGATLTPGVYTYAAIAPWSSGTLTLDGQSDPDAQWIFQIGSALTTPAGAVVSLVNGVSPDHVFWQVGSSATLGSANTFAGKMSSRRRASPSVAAHWTAGRWP